MAAKKNTTHATPRETHKVHKRKVATIDNTAPEASTPAEMVRTETAETPANPAVAAQTTEAAADATADSLRIDTPQPAEETTATADSSLKPRHWAIRSVLWTRRPRCWARPASR